MISTDKICDINAQVQDWHARHEIVAFVPTMGNLHEGHISLIREAKKRAHHVIVSIFVNPMQFGENEDLDAYPKTLNEDKQALENIGVELLFIPTTAVMYPNGCDVQTFIEVPEISNMLCGKSRPSHFRGVATVVCKLFNIVQPDIALFGKKDFQQLLVIKAMVADLSLPIEIIGVDTVRESSGLALSSRNNYLTVQEKAIAPKLKQALDTLATDILLDVKVDDAIVKAKKYLNQAGFDVDYIEVRSVLTLRRPHDEDKSLVILAAAKLGRTRLIDNVELQR